MDKLIKMICEFDEHKETWYALSKKVFAIYKDLSNNTDFFDTTAKIKFQYVKSLENCGFTRKEAMSILLNDEKLIKTMVRGNNHEKN